MEIIHRLKSAARILLKGEAQTQKRTEIPAITADEVAEIRQFFPREKFFILGHARSGTTILMRLARLHPEVHCNYQAHFFTRHPLLKSLVNTPDAEEWLTRKSNRWNGGRDLSPLVMRAAADFIERIAGLSGARMAREYAQLLERQRAEEPGAERVEPWSYAKFCYLKQRGWKGFVEGPDTSIYGVGPLARLNAAEGMATPRAQASAEPGMRRNG